MFFMSHPKGTYQCVKENLLYDGSQLHEESTSTCVRYTCIDCGSNVRKISELPKEQYLKTLDIIEDHGIERKL